MSNLIFSTNSYTYLAEDFKQQFELKHSCKLGNVERKVFPDGELYHRIEDSVCGKRVFLIGGTINDTETLELYDLANGIVANGCKSLTIILPYFGYSTMDRVTKEGEIIKSEIRAKLLSSLPSGRERTLILFLDLHTEHLMHYFTREVLVQQLNTRKVVGEYLNNLEGDVVLMSPDQGRKKAVELLAKNLNLDSGFCVKERISGDKVGIVDCSINPEFKNIIICDDMIRTGGTMIQAAQYLKDRGANKISLLATHGVFADYPDSILGDKLIHNSFEKLLNSPFDEIIIFDTYPKVNDCIKKAKELGLEEKFKVLKSSSVFIDFLETFN